jgi:two-component system chemotaxis sensor kinase CheA
MQERDLASLAAETEELARTAERDLQSLSAAVDGLIGEAKKMLMQPFSAILDLLPKLIRDLTRQQGKEAELSIRGAEIEIDKRILEEMKDPFIHLVRNCIDHGIEIPEERDRKGKGRKGTVSISCAPVDGGNVEILIEDDGAGIDCAKVRAAAARIGILSGEQAEKLSEAEALPLIFHSGLTTSPLITDVSGRGLGLAIAREKVDKLGGRISLNRRPGGGTAFRIVLPLTLASFRAVIVQAAERLFAFPAAGVERVVEVKSEEVRTVENREALLLGERVVALVRLRDLLELPGPPASAESTGKLPAVVLGGELAVLVDQVLDEQEILVKGLGSQLKRVRNLAGAAILGTGRTVPVLNIPDLIKSAQRLSESGLRPPARAEDRVERSNSVLLVEDSITSRMLLKGILENAGYEVGLAVNGLDALSRLRAASFDLVVSDVQMPRMNGFDLTAAIRADKKLGELPVVLVTALESREDRERGIEVGANAYIVKSSFDQGNLLEIIGRLL